MKRTIEQPLTWYVDDLLCVGATADLFVKSAKRGTATVIGVADTGYTLRYSWTRKEPCRGSVVYVGEWSKAVVGMRDDRFSSRRLRWKQGFSE